MIDTLWEMILQIFTYFFSQNAPMTVVMLTLSFSLWLYLKSRETSIVKPLEIASHQQALLKKQMDMAEKPLDQLRSKLYGLYRHERRLGLEKSGLSVDDARTKLDQDMETFLHSLQLRGVHGALRGELRSYFRDNHLADKTEEEFTSYIEKRKKQVWNSLVEALNEYWFSGMIDPSRSDVYDVHEVNKDAILAIVEEVFREGRVIARAYKQEVEAKKPRFWGKLSGLF